MPTRSRHIPNEILDAIINTEGSRVPFYWNGPSANSAIPVLCEGITGIAPASRSKLHQSHPAYRCQKGISTDKWFHSTQCSL